MADLVNIFYIVLGVVILTIILRIVLPSKGEVGEKIVAGRLLHLPESQYFTYNDVILPTAGGSTQIDHLVISSYGIFVIETKYYSGWIYGGENSEFWTQNIYGNKYQMYNPVLQNAGHVRAVKRVLAEFGDLPIIPIVAFSGQADLKVNVSSMAVVYWSQLQDTIRQYKTTLILSSDVKKICMKIEEVRLSSEDKEVRKRHVANAKNIQRRKEQSVSKGFCPRCGGKLELRKGKYGEFYGCSNYPECKYTITT